MRETEKVRDNCSLENDRLSNFVLFSSQMKKTGETEITTDQATVTEGREAALDTGEEAAEALAAQAAGVSDPGTTPITPIIPPTIHRFV